jgi:LPPG:FO 2-phospho-L-lactate transferase
MLAALAGGVGAARFLAGLVQCVDPSEITVVGNTGDDEEFFGLHVSPDLDSITYTLAGASNTEQGWGLEGESFRTMHALARYGEPNWFNLGDLDLATHIFRTRRMRGDGATLAEVTADVAAAWKLDLHLLPMTNDSVRTRITCARSDGTREVLAMQEWFVRERAEPAVLQVDFDGAGTARPAPGVLDALDRADTIVICPSNPIISIGPILAIPGVRDALVRRRDRVVAVCPIIDGAPVRGPADRLMAPLGVEVSPAGVARHYREFCATLVIDERDAAHAEAVRAAGVRPVVTETLMRSPQIAAELAQCTLAAVA